MISFNLPKLAKGAITREIVCGANTVRMPGSQRDFIGENGEGYVLRDLDAGGNVIAEHKLVGTVLAQQAPPKAEFKLPPAPAPAFPPAPPKDLSNLFAKSPG